MKIILSVLLTVIALANMACSSEEQKPKKHVFDSQVQALDKAKQVQQQMDAAEIERRKKIEEQMR